MKTFEEWMNEPVSATFEDCWNASAENSAEEIASLQTRLKGCTQEYERVSGRFDELKAEIAKRDERIAELEQDLQTTADALGHAHQDIERLERESSACDLLEEQKGTIKALNWALGGEDSTSTENLIDAYEVDYAEEGLIPLCRKLTQENVRLEDVVLFQKKAWTADFEELERLKDQIASQESSPITEEIEDILRSEIAKRDEQIEHLKFELENWEAFASQNTDRIKELEEQCRTNHSMEIDSLARKCDRQAAEISRFRDVLAKCRDALEAWQTTGLDEQQCDEALAAIKEIEHD